MKEKYNVIYKAPRETPCTLYKDGIYIRRINRILDFDYICMQIRQNKIEGYSIKFKGVYYNIDKNGRIKEHWPRDLFPLMDEYLINLI